jgi:hypothetical protein
MKRVLMTLKEYNDDIKEADRRGYDRAICNLTKTLKAMHASPTLETIDALAENLDYSHDRLKTLCKAIGIDCSEYFKKFTIDDVPF